MARADRFLAALTLFSVSMTFGCTRPADLARPGALAELEKKVLKRETSFFANRGLAEESGTRPACLKDRMTLQWIKEQALEEERKYAGQPVVGTWNGIDLSRLHRAGGTLLTQYGNVIYSGSDVSYTGCTGIPCIYNRIYGVDDDAEQGWKAYFWFLRTGTALSAINRVHDQNSSEAGVYMLTSRSLASYLFKDDELSGFWKVANSAGVKYRSSRYFKRLHRIPHEANIEDEGATVCGVAYPSGEIILKDSCVATYSGGLYRGFFYAGVPHEISHQIDMDIGPGHSARFAESEEFRELSGWFEDEYTESSGTRRSRWALPWPEEEYVSDSGATKKRWVIPDASGRNGLDGFVRDYAASSPAEDFADSSAYIRYRAEDARESIPRKIALISEKVYGGRTFDDEGLSVAYKDIGKRAVESALPRMVRDCVAPQAVDPAAPESSAPAIDLGVSLPPSIQGCINRSFAALLDAAVANIKATELDACDFLSAEKETALRTYWLAELKGPLGILVSDERRVARIVQATEEFRTDLQAWVDPREAYLNCFRSRSAEGQPNIQECYDRVLSEAFDRVASGYAEALEEVLEIERARFVADHSLEASQARTQELYTAIFGGVEVLLRSKSNSRWRDCLAAPTGNLDGTAVLLTAPYSGGSLYVASQVLNCINLAVESDLDEIRDRFTGDKFQIGSQEARAFLRLVVLQPRYLDLLHERANRLAGEEQRRLEELLTRKTADLQASLLSQRTWIDGAADLASARARCDVEAASRIQGQLTTGTDAITPAFSSVSQIERTVATNACREVMRSAELQRNLEAMAQRGWQTAIANLEAAVVRREDRQAEVCWTEYSRRTSTHRMGRRRCLTRHWNRASTRGFEDWSATPEGQRYSSRHQEARTHLTSRKTALLNAALGRMESMH